MAKSIFQQIVDMLPAKKKLDLDAWFEAQYPTRDKSKPLIQEFTNEGKMTMYVAKDGRNIFSRDRDVFDADFRKSIAKHGMKHAQEKK